MERALVLYQMIYRHIKDQILAGELAPGSRVPNEKDLMATFGVSRATTARALQLLQAEQLIVRHPGLGTFVSNPDTQPTANPTEQDPVAGAAPTQFIGFVAPYLTGTFGAAFVDHLAQRADAADRVLAVGCSRGSQATEERMIARLIDRGVGGLIVIPVNGEYYNRMILRLHLDGFPIVLVDKQFPGIPIPSVTTENHTAAVRLTEVLLQHGHQRIAYVSPDPANTSSLAQRFDGFCSALKAAEVPWVDDYLVVPQDTESEAVEGRIRQMYQTLDSHPEITAIFASDELLAEVCVEAAHRLDRTVPRDLSIVCFDGRSIPSGWAYTAIRQDTEAMARHAITIIETIHDGNNLVNGPDVSVPASLVEGHSVGSCLSLDGATLVSSRDGP